jgi:cell wall-associated NlpC family hydrolase
MKHLLITVAILLGLAVAQITYLQLKGEKVLEKNGVIPVTVEEQEEITRDVIEDMIAFGESKQGLPYVWGEWDCSKFISEMLKQQGVLSARLTTRDFAKWDRVDQPTRGDLVLFAHSGDRISHIGLLIEKTEDLTKWLMMHNSSSRGVVKDRFGKYWTPRYRYSVAIQDIGRTSK